MWNSFDLVPKSNLEVAKSLETWKNIREFVLEVCFQVEASWQELDTNLKWNRQKWMYLERSN